MKKEVFATNRKVAVLVLGMHRSGTSLLAGILDRLGCKGPNTPAPGDVYNEKGYFESRPIYRLNDEILAATGLKWDDWSELEPGWHLSPRFVEFRKKAADTVVAEYGAASLIYLKDPRICRLLPLWQQVLEDAGYDVVCIHTHRNPKEVAQSLELRNHATLDAGSGMLLWLRYNLEAETNSRNLPRIFTSYSDVLKNWASVADAAEQKFGFNWPVTQQWREERVSSLVEPGLRHHNTDANSRPLRQRFPKLISDSLDILEKWSSDREHVEDRDILDGLRDQFNMAASLFFQPLRALDKKRLEVSALRKEAEAEKESFSLLKAEKDLLAEQVADASARLAEEQAALKGALSERDESLEKERIAHEEIQAARVALAQAQSNFEEKEALWKSEILAMSENLAARDKVAAELVRDFEIQRQEMEAREESLREEAAAAQVEMAAALADTSAAQEIEEALSQAAATHEAERRELEAELSKITENLVERDKIIIALRQDISAGKRNPVKAAPASQPAQTQASPVAVENPSVLDTKRDPGSIQSLSSYRVSGWVPADYEVPPILDVSVGGKPVGQATVNLERSNRRCTFHFRFSPVLNNRSLGGVRVLNRATGEVLSGKNAPMLRGWFGGVRPLSGRIEGWVDRIDRTMISGWVVDNLEVDNPPAPVLLVDGVQASLAPSRYSRGDLVASGFGAADLGFNFNLRTLGLKPGKHKISVMTAGKTLPVVRGQEAVVVI